MKASTVVRDYLGRQQHIGAWPQDEPEVISGAAGTPTQGAIIRLQLKCDGDNIRAVCFKAYGCGFTIASAAWLCDTIEGNTVIAARQLHNTQIVEALELPPTKVHCAVLAVQALQAALMNRIDRER